MLFIHNETGEIIEVLVRTVGQEINNSGSVAFSISGIVILGSFQETPALSEDGKNSLQDYKFLGFL